MAIFLDENREVEWDESSVLLEATIGHGPGGQHRNKTATAIRAVHKDTGTTVFIQGNRSQKANKREAIDVVKSRVLQKARQSTHEADNRERNKQIGSGERSDKVRTVQEQNGRVVQHTNGKSCSLASYLKGEIWKLS